MIIFNKHKVNNAINKIDSKTITFVMQYAKASNKIKNYECQDLINFSYQIVKIDIPDLLSKGQYLQCAELLFEEKFFTIKIQELITFILWLTEQINHIQKIEKSKLDSIPDAELIQAGINNLDVFGEINIIDSLANGDVLKWDLILELPYYRVLDKLSKSNVERQIQKNYQKIMEQKAKRK